MSLWQRPPGPVVLAYFFTAQGFFAAQGLAALAAQGLAALAAQGLAALAAQGFFAAQGLLAWAAWVGSVVGSAWAIQRIPPPLRATNRSKDKARCLTRRLGGIEPTVRIRHLRWLLAYQGIIAFSLHERHHTGIIPLGTWPSGGERVVRIREAHRG